jgi:hypothetical protein
MAVVGAVPAHPLEIVQRDGVDDVRLPAQFEQLLNDGRSAQKATLHQGDKVSAAVGNTKVTGRGCPVAGRGPLRGIDGKIELSPESGVSILTHAMIQLTRKLLAA